MWAWGMSTKGVTSRFRWRRTSISGRGAVRGTQRAARQRERVGGATPQRPARAAVWRDGMAETDCQASRPGIGVPLAGSAGHRAAGRGGQRLITAHVCLPLLPISDLSRFPFRFPFRLRPVGGCEFLDETDLPGPCRERHRPNEDQRTNGFHHIRMRVTALGTEDSLMCGQRRRYLHVQFTMRTVLAAVTLSALVCSWLKSTLRGAGEKKRRRRVSRPPGRSCCGVRRPGGTRVAGPGSHSDGRGGRSLTKYGAVTATLLMGRTNVLILGYGQDP